MPIIIMLVVSILFLNCSFEDCYETSWELESTSYDFTIIQDIVLDTPSINFTIKNINWRSKQNSSGFNLLYFNEDTLIGMIPFNENFNTWSIRFKQHIQNFRIKDSTITNIDFSHPYSTNLNHVERNYTLKIQRLDSATLYTQERIASYDELKGRKIRVLPFYISIFRNSKQEEKLEIQFEELYYEVRNSECKDYSFW